MSATAVSNGKNMANTGNKMVPKPKPEKNVSPEPIKLVKHIKRYGNIINLSRVCPEELHIIKNVARQR